MPTAHFKIGGVSSTGVSGISTVTTAQYTPKNVVTLLIVENYHATPASVSTVSLTPSSGGAWITIATAKASSGNRRITIFAYLSNSASFPGPTLTLTALNGISQTWGYQSVWVCGIDCVGTTGGEYVVQSKTADSGASNVTSLAVALDAALSQIGNAILAAYASSANGSSVDPKNTYGELYDADVGGVLRAHVSASKTPPDVTANATFASSLVAGIAVELKAVPNPVRRRVAASGVLTNLDTNRVITASVAKDALLFLIVGVYGDASGTFDVTVDSFASLGAVWTRFGGGTIGSSPAYAFAVYTARAPAAMDVVAIAHAYDNSVETNFSVIYGLVECTNVDWGVAPTTGYRQGRLLYAQAHDAGPGFSGAIGSENNAVLTLNYFRGSGTNVEDAGAESDLFLQDNVQWISTHFRANNNIGTWSDCGNAATGKGIAFFEIPALTPTEPEPCDCPEVETTVLEELAVVETELARDIYVDEPTNNIALTPGGDLALVGGVPSIVQAIRQKVRTFLAEWFLDEEEGLPWFESIFVKNPNVPVIRALLRDAILDVPGVLDLTRLTLVVDPAARAMTATFEATSDTGEFLSDTVDVTAGVT